MSYNNKVVWADGYLLRSQHFQQERRYLEHFVDHRVRALMSYGWGFTALEVDRDLLAIGKVGLAKVEGLFADGTPLVLPGNDEMPKPLDVDPDVKDEIVYLSLPVASPGQQEVFFDKEEALTRHGLREVDIRDETSAQAGDTALLQLAAIRPQLRLQSQALEGFITLGTVRIREVRSDRQVVLDDQYVAPMLDARSHAQLDSVITQISSLLQHRGQELGGRVSASGRGGAAEITDFLMLQTVNRYDPLFRHFRTLERLHPKYLFETAVQLAGELATFNEGGRPPEFPIYDHDALERVFEPIVLSIREGLERVIVRRAEPIDLRRHPDREQWYLAQIGDTSLIDGATFVLSVSADVPADKLRQTFPKSAKVAAKEDINEVVKNLLPGVALMPMNSAPRQIPYHAGNIYFEMDTSSDLWAGMQKTGGLALHLGQRIPGVELELWAIRR